MQTKSVIRQKNAAVAQAKRHLSVDVVPCYVCVRKRRSAKPANPKPLNPLPENVLLGSTSENLSVDLDEFDAASCLQTRGCYNADKKRYQAEKYSGSAG